MAKHSVRDQITEQESHSLSKLCTAGNQFGPSLWKPATLGLFLCLAVSTAWAWPPTYGAEFELSREGLGVYDFTKGGTSNSDEKKEQLRFIERVTEKCLVADCTVVASPGKWDTDFRVTYKDGWWFKVSYDPGCVEITFKPSTLEVLKEKATLINDQIFGTGIELGLKYDPDVSAHFNIGVNSAFDGEAKDFLRFFVDYANRPDLSLGSLGHDINNAPPLAALQPEQRQALQKIITETEQGTLTTIKQVASAIQYRVYTSSYDKEWGGIAHYQAIGLKYVNRTTDLQVQDAPMELRAVWGQGSAERFNRIARLMEARFRYLKSLNPAPIIYNQTSRQEFSAEELHTRFAIYVAETGLNWKNYESLLHEQVRQAALDPIMDSNAPIEDRLENIKNYLDLIPLSPWMQNRVAKLLKRRDAKDLPITAELRKLITEKASADPTSGYQKIQDQLVKKPKPLPSIIPAPQPVELPGSCKNIFA